MSVGAVTQTVTLNTDELNLVLGENLDLGGEDNRNGVGKTSILNALSYALYDSALTKIKKDNLVNKTNEKDMLVTLDFEVNGVQYRIERGRRKNVLRFWVNNKEFVTQEDDTNEAQGDNRVTQKEIEACIGMSHNMFKNIVGLNTYSEPFLSMRAADQKNIIEELLGITKLSEKAESLKVLLRDTKDKIKEEEYKISAIKGANETIEKNIKMLSIKSNAWAKNYEAEVLAAYEALEKLKKVSVEEEINNHKLIAEYNASMQKYKEYKKEVDGYQREINLHKKAIASAEEKLKTSTSGNQKICHTCGQSLSDSKHKEIQDNILADIETHKQKIDELTVLLNKAQQKLDNVTVPDVSDIKTFYNTIDEAYDHKSSIESLTKHLEELAERENPYTDQINSLQNEGLQEVDYTLLEELVSLREHQEFLLKLLTNKDSFVRKKIIDQNLNYLNLRLEHHLSKTGLPHQVKFLSDLSVEITEHGRDLDFDNLSRGERTRLILSLCLAFRDVYESLHNKVNLLFIDELMDNGLDTNGVENGLHILKGIVRDYNKSVFLVSHREELIGRVDNTIKVIKEGGFTSIDQNTH